MSKNGHLVLMTDGSCLGNPGAMSCGWVLWTRYSDRPFAVGGRALGQGTNNVAEWQALIDGLRAARDHGACRVTAYTDSKLVACQFSGEWKTADIRLQVFNVEAHLLARQIGGVTVHHVLRQLIHLADRQARAAHEE